MPGQWVLEEKSGRPRFVGQPEGGLRDTGAGYFLLMKVWLVIWHLTPTFGQRVCTCCMRWQDCRMVGSTASLWGGREPDTLPRCCCGGGRQAAAHRLAPCHVSLATLVSHNPQGKGAEFIAVPVSDMFTFKPALQRKHQTWVCWGRAGAAWLRRQL